MSSWQSDLSGNTFTSSALTGRTAANLLRNQGFASRVVSMRVSEQDVTEASRQADAARGEMVSAGNERSTVLTEAFTKGLAKLKSSRSSSGTSTSSFEQLGETLTRLDQITKTVADSTGLTQAQVASIAFGASAHLGLSTPVAGASVQGNAGKSYQTGLSADQRKVLGAMSNEQIAEFKQFGDRVSRDASTVALIAADSRESRELASRLANTSSRTERAEASYGERSALAERLSSARERGEVLSIDIAQDPYNLEMFMRYAERYGGNSAAALSLMDSELARQGLPPTRVFSNGVAVPESFARLHREFQENSTATKLNPKLDAAPRIPGVLPRSELPSGTTTSEQSDLRDDVRRGGAQLRVRADDARAGFDAKDGTSRSADGTLSTEKSLLLQTGRQVAADAGSTLDEARKAAGDLLKKKR